MILGNADQHKEQPPESSPSPAERGRQYLVPAEEYEQFLQWRSDSEIDLSALLDKLWQQRWFIGKVTAAVTLIGILLSFMMKPEYTTDASLMPEYNTESVGGGTAQQLLDQYGGMLGIGGGTYASSSNAIRVELYPQIVQSLPFQLELVEDEFYYPEYDTTATLFAYFDSIYRYSVLDYLLAYTVYLPFTAKAWISYWMRPEEQQREVSMPGRMGETEVISISREKMEVVENMRQRISASLDQESGVISVRATMPSAKLSADVAKEVIEKLTAYLVEYRTKKIKMDLTYLREQHQKVQDRFYAIRDSLAEFRDANRNMVTARAQTREQGLQSRYDLAYNLYNGLSQQLEQTKLRLQEQTPVFKTLDPVQVPIEKSSPNRMLIAIVCFILGGIGAVGYLFGRPWIEELRRTTKDG